MAINKDQQKRSNDGNEFERKIYRNLKKDDKLDIIKIKAKKRFFYSEKKLEETIADRINSSARKYTKKEIKQMITRAIKNSITSGGVLRSKTKYYKEADVSFLTNKNYVVNNNITQVRFIFDMTTSARTDRIKGKAQDSSVYKQLGFPYVYMIVLPDDEHFESYKNKNNEIRQCNNAVYDANFCNVYKKDGVSLIVREKDLYDLLHYVMKNEGKDINKLLDNWKKRYYKDMTSKRKEDIDKYTNNIFNKVMPLVKTSKVR